VIQAVSLSKTFKLYRSPADRLKEIVTRKKHHVDFHALNDISFTVEDGATLGIVGQNGAGKSTLLKILTGILMPDSGEIVINGKITGLLELGTGFNYEMTGIENLYMNGILLGMSREEIDQKRQAIVEFSELGNFVYEQLKTYSSGMTMRLAFSIAIHADPKCFVVDEALSVGDAHFQQKCMNRIREFRQAGGSIIFVSHDMNAIKVLCDKAILLNRGTVVEEGHPEDIVNHYNFLISKMNDSDEKMKLVTDNERQSYGTFEAKIMRATIKGERSGSNVIGSGEYAVITLEIESVQDLPAVTAGIMIRDKYGQDIYGTNTYHHEIDIALQRGRIVSCSFRLRLDIGPGKYTLTTALHPRDSHVDECYHWADSILSFEVAGNAGGSFVGMCKLYPDIKVSVRDEKVPVANSARQTAVQKARPEKKS
jgi:homopolymeric O-antigen transport system ATP-binding protein